MKIILTIGCVLSAYITFAQDCEYVKNEVDEFTGDKIVSTGFVDFMGIKNQNGTRIQFASTTKVQRSIVLSLAILSDEILSIDKGNKVMFKLLNNEIVELSCLKYSSSEVSNNSWIIAPPLLLDSESLKKLKTNSVTKIRVYINNGYFENDIDKDYRTVIGRILNCVDI